MGGSFCPRFPSFGFLCFCWFEAVAANERASNQANRALLRVVGIFSFPKRKAVATKTTNSRTGAKFDKFRVRVQPENSAEKFIYLGRHESTEQDALSVYDFGGCSYRDEDKDEEIVAREPNCVCIDVLTELMSKIGGIVWDAAALKSIASSRDTDNRKASPTVRWLDSVLNEDGMVDTFRHFHPDAQSRFTCWNQYTNGRYENKGCRIDYMLVDKVLLGKVQKGDALRCCNYSSNQPLGEEAAWHAATASGAFQPASFEGDGISCASERELQTQFGPPHTGIIYTPPSYSDHVATSLLICPEETNGGRLLLLNERDPKTKSAQPHKLQRSIASFFAPNDKSKATKSPTSTTTDHKDEIEKEQQGEKNEQQTKSQQKRQQISAGKNHQHSTLLRGFKRSGDNAGPRSKGKRQKIPCKKRNSILHHFAPNS